jgi:hypothetical protein
MVSACLHALILTASYASPTLQFVMYVLLRFQMWVVDVFVVRESTTIMITLNVQIVTLLACTAMVHLLIVVFFVTVMEI